MKFIDYWPLFVFGLCIILLLSYAAFSSFTMGVAKDDLCIDSGYDGYECILNTYCGCYDSDSNFLNRTIFDCGGFLFADCVEVVLVE